MMRKDENEQNSSWKFLQTQKKKRKKKEKQQRKSSNYHHALCEKKEKNLSPIRLKPLTPYHLHIRRHAQHLYTSNHTQHFHTNTSTLTHTHTSTQATHTHTHTFYTHTHSHQSQACRKISIAHGRCCGAAQPVRSEQLARGAHTQRGGICCARSCRGNIRQHDPAAV